MRVELLGLDKWLGLNSIRVVGDVREGDDVEVRISYRNHEIKYETPTADISIENLILGVSPFGSLFDAPESEINIRQTNWLIYSPKTSGGVSGFLLVRRRTEELISLLLGTYFSLDWPTLVVKNDNFDAWYKLYFYRGTSHGSAPSVYFLWTTFPSVRHSFGHLLYRWQEMVMRYGAGYELYIAPLQDPLPHPEHSFVNLVWAIESLHRNWQRDAAESARDSDTKRRVNEILERFDQPADKSVRQWLKGKLKYAHEPTLETRIFEAFGRIPIALDPTQLRHLPPVVLQNGTISLMRVVVVLAKHRTTSTASSGI
jgi:ApeA N-terminal domain 1